MALQGTLDTFSLPDVLRLLATTAKTGRLRIEGDRGRGSVWLADGGIVDADADRVTDGTPTDEVLFELLRFSEGSFAFEAEEKAANGGEPEDVEALLRRSHSLLSEWRELENVVPSLEHEVRLATDLSTDEVTIDAERWRSLVAVAGGRTVGELAAELGLTTGAVSRMVDRLQAGGFVRRARDPSDARRVLVELATTESTVGLFAPQFADLTESVADLSADQLRLLLAHLKAQTTISREAADRVRRAGRPHATRRTRS